MFYGFVVEVNKKSVYYKMAFDCFSNMLIESGLFTHPSFITKEEIGHGKEKTI